MSKRNTSYRRHLIQIPFLLTALILFTTSLVPILLLPDQASAAQLTSRSLSISSGQSGATSTTYTYTFTPSAAALSSVKFVACTAATATYGFASVNTTTGCTAPTGMNINLGSTSSGTTAGNGWTNTGAFSIQSSTLGDCTPAANVLCIKRTAGSAETAVSHTFSWGSETNPTVSGNGTTFYVGIYTYSDASFGTPQDSGTVASAVVPALQVTAAVAELLVFCIGSTSVDDATTAVGSASSCSGTTVDLGTLDPTAINYSKTNGNNLNGVAILRTNAINGSAVYYDSIQDTDTGSGQHGDLKIQGVNCVGGVNPNPNACITSKASQGVFTAGTSDFGMTIAGTNCGTASTYYACVFSSGTEHLKAVSPYVGNTTSAFCSPTNCNSNNGFIWDDTGASDKIAAAAANNVVADEALILKFAATPSITSTFGSYSVKVDFTAVPTF